MAAAIKADQHKFGNIFLASASSYFFSFPGATEISNYKTDVKNVSALITLMLCSSESDVVDPISLGRSVTQKH